MPRQRIMRMRRQYNQWVGDQTLEDYALRFTAHKARVWSPLWVTNTAVGSIAFLACEALGATATVAYGVHSLALALIVAGVIFTLMGTVVCYYGARYGVDIDLLTRGAGFGYLGSTITSAVYAGFTLILFAIEALILSAALNLCTGLALPLAHVISALVVVPIALHGFRRISLWQNWTQPVWLILQLAPIAWLIGQGAPAARLWLGYAGETGIAPLVGCGMALAILLSLLPQLGEQVDYLRFLPPVEQIGRRRWWLSVLISGPGWIIIGGIKILIGSALAVLAVSRGVAPVDAVNPARVYFAMFSALAHDPRWGMVLTGVFVAICQTKINVTNAYAGSIACSNFFSRLTHRHPGRAIWVVFNVLIALMLMENGIQSVVERVLALYSNFAVAWFGAVVADLAVNKPLGLSPRGIEFKRAHLYDINPVGVGAMLISLMGSSLCLMGAMGATLQPFSPLVGLMLAFGTAPAIAFATRGGFYLTRQPSPPEALARVCVICENAFEPQDMAHCPVYAGTICSLCCTLEARCHDACRPQGQVGQQAADMFRAVLPALLFEFLSKRMARFLMLYGAIAAGLGLVCVLIYQREAPISGDPASIVETLRMVWVVSVIVSGFVAWYVVLARESQHAAEEESLRQTTMLVDEIEAHRRTDGELMQARHVAEAANLAKSRYIVGISHEIRAPLSTISGYAQLVERDPAHTADAVRVIRRSTAHLVNLVDGLLDISRIENGSLRIERERLDLADMLDQIVDMFRLQAAAKGLVFEHERDARLPSHIYTDPKRLRQVLINLVSNAIKYTPQGSAALTVRWRNPVAEFIVSDTGVGIAPGDLERIFEPFERVGPSGTVPGIGLGLTISRLLANIMGGELTVASQPGGGTTFGLKMFLSEAPPPATQGTRPRGRRLARSRSILVADDDAAHLALIEAMLAPLGFDLHFANGGEAALADMARRPADLVMLDIAMPGMNGWDTARAIRKSAGEEPVILMVSANVHDFQRPRREDDPHDDYLPKPFDLDSLLDRIDLLLDLTWTDEEHVAHE